MQMSVTKKEGADIFKSEAQTWINTVNCVGVMGKGIAKGFKQRFPTLFEDYEKRCERKEVKLGEPYPFFVKNERSLFPSNIPEIIINFPTKDHWRSQSKLSDIENGFKHLLKNYKKWGIRSMAVPPLGCGAGGLEWSVVGNMILENLEKFDIPVELYLPDKNSSYELKLEKERGKKEDPNLKQGVKLEWRALVHVVNEIQKHPFRGVIGHIFFQKICYFSHVYGLLTGFKFEKGSYGPFSGEVKKMLNTLVNHGLLKEKKVGNAFVISVSENFYNLLNADSQIQSYIQSNYLIIEKVKDIMLRAKNTTGAEIASTVHFTFNELKGRLKAQNPSEESVFKGVSEWKVDRDPPLNSFQVKDIIRSLNTLGIITADITPNFLPSNKRENAEKKQD